MEHENITDIVPDTSHYLDDVVLRAENISMSYKSVVRKKNVLNGAYIEIKKGGFYAVRGVSGCGKSTFLGILAGLLRPDTGKVVYIRNGEEVEAYSLGDRELAMLRGRFISYIPQRCDYIPELSVLDNIRLSDYFSKRDKRDNSIPELLGLQGILSEKPDRLSGGELRRMVIARSIYQSPEVLLADEPTNDLDEENKKITMDALHKISEAGTAVVIVTHDEGVAGFAEDVYELSDGILLHR